MPVHRRTFLTGCAAAAVGALAPRLFAGEESSVLASRDIEVGGEGDLARRARVLWPRAAPATARLPVLVLLHGLGETSSEKLGLLAWPERYGLVHAYERLVKPPVKSAISGSSHWSKDRLASVNAELAEHPMSGVVLVCPVTPNVYRHKPTGVALDRYAAWIEEKLLPEVRAQFPAIHDAAGTAIDGCSLGGYMALEVFLRKPGLFGGFGVVQAAIGEAQANEYARRMEALPKEPSRRIHLLTSAWDPYRGAHEHLSKRLTRARVAHDLTVLPGGHDQIFLREIGSPTMLLWHERRFRERRSKKG